jgi:hypothetical protein
MAICLTGHAVCDNSIMTMATTTWGGARVGAGRKSAYPGKDFAHPVYLDFTQAGRDALDALQARTKLSRSDILAHLIAKHAESLDFGPLFGVAFPGKLGENVCVIRLPVAQRRLLRATRTRTGKSYSDIGEALVLWRGLATVFPARPQAS